MELKFYITKGLRGRSLCKAVVLVSWCVLALVSIWQRMTLSVPHSHHCDEDDRFSLSLLGCPRCRGFSALLILWEQRLFEVSWQKKTNFGNKRELLHAYRQLIHSFVKQTGVWSLANRADGSHWWLQRSWTGGLSEALLIISSWGGTISEQWGI